MTRELSAPSANIESLLRAERSIPAQPDAVRERVLRRAQASLGEPPVALPGAGVPRVLVSAGAAALLLAALGVATYLRWPHGGEGRPSPPPAETADRDPQSLPPEPVPTANAPPATSSAAATASPALPERSRTPREDEMAELHLLERARGALARGDFGNAWSVLVTHEQRFPRGRLVEEREALKVNTLLGLGRREDAHRVASDFRNRFPQSVLLARMGDVLSGP